MNSTASPIHQCLECNAPLSPSEAHGLCARCLLKIGLASQFGEASVGGAGTRKLQPPPMFPFDFGEYRVLRLLGRGGMGAVYEAEQISNGRRIALKVLGHTMDSPDMRKRFLREGRLAASVNHPNSVYIFGTEEIEGAPVISMELVAGGTLRDRVKSGGLPVKEAIDAILDIVAGLDAAASVGVLHRDVKPANCFVSPDGTVKVGDFGLSVSTLARHDSQLTASGVMLGTPSYAAPEQLRGDELDVRADIYSVGATLYALLTGHPPFEGENAVQVVAAVLDKTPKPIGEFRKNVPEGLSQLVAKCLAKKPGDRFANYAELRDALAPFSSSAPEPAPLGLRFFAGMIDTFVAALPNSFATIALGQSYANAPFEGHPSIAILRWVLLALWLTAYFTICEWRWGAALGKALCGLRVTEPGGDRPSFSRALLRAAIFTVAYLSSSLIYSLLTSAAHFRMSHTFSALALSEIGTVFLALLFITMRRANGFAALHELASGTRTVTCAKSAARPRLDVPASAEPDSAEGEHVGPYRLLGSPASGPYLDGFDEVLRRRVWILPSPAGAPPLSSARREIDRPTRLRWIGGARSDLAGWDAFEAPQGQPMGELHAQPWASVRGWLQDIAAEIDAASKDATLPDGVSLAHVWITADGRAVVLDEPCPPHAPAAARSHSASPAVQPLLFPDAATPAGAQRFLSAAASATLDHSALPVHARDFLGKLGTGAFDRVTFILGNLQSLLAKPACVTRRRRFAALALLPGSAAVLSLVMAVTTFAVFHRNDANMATPRGREWHELSNAANFYASVQGETPATALIGKRSVNQKMADNAAIYIVGHFGKSIQKPTFDREAAAAGLNLQQRDLARGALAAHPSIKPEELAKADAELGPALGMMDGFVKKFLPWMGPAFFSGMLLFIGAGSLLSTAIFGIAPVLHSVGLAVVDRNDRPASRLRLLARSALVWAPMVAGWVAIFAITLRRPSGFHNTSWTVSITLFALSALGFLIGVPWTLRRPSAGPHDRLTGTRVVPL